MNYIKSIFILSALIFIGCNQGENTTSRETEAHADNEIIHVTKAQFDSANMEVGRLTDKPFAQTVKTTGIIDVPPQSKAVISAFSGGYVKNTPLLIGDKVSKGQRLVTLENPEFITMQQSYLETAEQLSYLKSEYERQKTMLEENITSQKSFLKAESDYKTAMARTTSLKKNLQMLNINPDAVLAGNIVSQVSIFNPIAGYVTGVFVNTGSYVSPSDKIMEIINTDHIHLELKVFEKDLIHIKKDQEVLFKVPEASQEYYKGDVHLVGTSIDPNSRVALVHGHIDHDNDAHFSTGMFVEAEIVTGASTALALPEEAVIELEGVYFVLLLESENDEEYEFHPLEVKVKQTYNGFTSFETQLPLDGTYLTKGGFVLMQVEGAGGHSH